MEFHGELGGAVLMVFQQEKASAGWACWQSQRETDVPSPEGGLHNIFSITHFQAEVLELLGLLVDRETALWSLPGRCPALGSKVERSALATVPIGQGFVSRPQGVRYVVKSIVTRSFRALARLKTCFKKRWARL